MKNPYGRVSIEMIPREDEHAPRLDAALDERPAGLSHARLLGRSERARERDRRLRGLLAR